MREGVVPELFSVLFVVEQVWWLAITITSHFSSVLLPEATVSIIRIATFMRIRM